MAKGQSDDPYDSVEDAVAAVKDVPLGQGGVFVTKDVYDAFDWRDHIALAKADSNRVVHGMNDTEDVACVRIIDRGVLKRWVGLEWSPMVYDSGWEAYAWRIEWINASIEQVAWMLHMAKKGAQAEAKKRQGGQDGEEGK